MAYDREVDTDSKQQDIFLIPLDGGEEIPLIEHPADDCVLGWLPDSQILPVSQRPRGRGVAMPG